MASLSEATDLTAWLEEARAWAEAALERHFDRADPGGRPEVPRLAEAMRYAVLGGGKRLRPAICRLACEWVGGPARAAEDGAVAVELVHAYSLVHDDLPCMDDDDLRRGRPSCHKVYGEAFAVLVGDALQARAFGVLGAGEADLAADSVRVLARAAGSLGMVGGQAIDIETEGAGAVPTAEVVADLHARKTAALIGAAAELGAVAGRADPERRAHVRRWGFALGRMFQATDDVLDVTGDSASLGKTPGKDQRLGKATLVAALGLEGARAQAGRLADEARGAARALGAGPGHPGLELVDSVLGRRS